MNEPHLRTLYKLLGHTGFSSRVGALNYTTKIYEQQYVSSEEAFLEFCRARDGKDNVFISRAARLADGSVSHANCVSFDLDPVRPKDTAATADQHNQALDAGRKILELYPGGYLASSGNGALLLYRWPRPLYDLEAHYKKEAILIDELQTLVGAAVKVDSTNYAEAIIKAIGTMSTKGDVALRRQSKFLDFPYMPYKVPTALVGKLEALTPAPKAPPPEREGNPIRRLQDAKVLLNKLGAERVDDYESWLKVGMALKEFGIAGLALWKNWSKRSPKYEEGACENKWETFADTPAVSLGSLAYWVKKDKPLSYFDGLFSPRGEDTEHIQTGLPSLDVALGELLRGEITTFAARSGFGKTTFSCTFAEHIRKTKRVLYFSTEMSASTIMHKMVALACHIPLARVIRRDFQPTERKRIEEYQTTFETHPILICDDFQPSIEKVRQEIADHHPDIVIFDHVSQTSTNWEGIAHFMRSLKELTAEYNTVTLVLSQLNEPPRDKSGTNAQSLRSDVRGTQEIIYLSSIFMYVTNPYEVKTDIQPVQIHVAKHRYGISGTVVETKVDKIISKFHE